MRTEPAYWGWALAEGKQWARAKGACVTSRDLVVKGESYAEDREQVLRGWSAKLNEAQEWEEWQQEKEELPEDKMKSRGMREWGVSELGQVNHSA